MRYLNCLYFIDAISFYFILSQSRAPSHAHTSRLSQTLHTPTYSRYGVNYCQKKKKNRLISRFSS